MTDKNLIEHLYQLYSSCGRVTTDTRNIGSGDLFFALKGEKFNANLFAAEAFEKGAQYVVVDELAEQGLKEKFPERLILVEDVLNTLQQLAGYHRKQLKCPVLAITGSNGKTTTKELIAAVLSKKFKTYATKGNLNNHIGIPLTLFAIKPDAEFAVIEMGANHQGEIASYCEYVKPGCGLITNVGLAHIEGFGGFEGVVKAKTELYRDVISRHGIIFVSGDNEILIEQLQKAKYEIQNIITYGKKPVSFCRAEVASNSEFLSLLVEGIRIDTNLTGEYNFENVVAAAAVGKFFGVEMKDIKEAIESYIPANNRSQKVSYGSNTILLDAYNANPSSMAEALKNFENIKAKNKIAILGEMMELGDYSQAEHEKVALAVGNMQLANKIFIGKGFEFLRNQPQLLWFENAADLKRWFREQHFENAYMLIKGSRKNALEKILED